MTEPVHPSAEAERLGALVERIRTGGSAALRECVEETQGVSCCAALWSTPRELERALATLDDALRAELEGFVRRSETLARQRVTRGRGLGTVACCAGLRGPFALHALLASVVVLRARGCTQLVLGVPDARAHVAAALALVAVDGVLLADGAAAVAAFAYGIAPAPHCELVLGWSPHALLRLAGHDERGVAVDVAALVRYAASTSDVADREPDAEQLVALAIAHVDSALRTRP